MARGAGKDLFLAKPYRSDDAFVQLPVRMVLAECPGKREAKVGELAFGLCPTVDARDFVRHELMGGFLKRFALDGGDERFIRLEVTCRLVSEEEAGGCTGEERGRVERVGSCDLLEDIGQSVLGSGPEGESTPQQQIGFIC